MPSIMDSMMQNTPSSAIPIPGGEDHRGTGDRFSRATSPPESELGGYSGGNSGGNGSSAPGPGSGRQRRPRSRRDRDKRYICDHPGCDKSYTRAEHLTRHQLNHQGNYRYRCRVDPNCSKVFHRSDLLTRHEDRHSARMAKKAASEEPHSPIRIAPSPPLARSPQNSPFGSPPRSPNRSPDPLMSPDVKPLPSDLATGRFMHASMTMPASTPNNALSSPSSENGYNDRSDEPWSAVDQAMDIDTQYGASSSPEYSRPPPMHTIYNEHPQSLPFVSPLLSASSPVYHQGFSAINQTQGYASSAQTIVDQSHIFPNSGPVNIPQSSYAIQPPMPVLSPPLQEGTGIFAFTGDSIMVDMAHHHHQENWDSLWQPTQNTNNFSWVEHSASLENYNEMNQSFPPPADSHMERRNSVYFPGVIPSSHDSNTYQKAVPVGALLSDGSENQSNSFISNDTRNHIIARMGWHIHEPYVMQNANHLSAEALSQYITYYWREFHTQYPILHRATTVITPNNIEHLPLFIAMITIGMALGGDESAYGLAQTMHDIGRWHIYQSPHFRMPAKLWEMQTLLLREIFDKMLSTRHHHEMAHIFHGALLTLMRRGTTLDGFLDRGDEMQQRENGYNLNTTDAELAEKWHAFVEEECTKRVAYLAFIIDSQHAMMFGHSLVLHAQELNLKPPCNEDVWAAGSAFEWHRATQRDSLDDPNAAEPRFIEILKMFMNEPSGTAKERLRIDSFACFIVLHGLISVKWHLEQKALGTGVTTNNASRATSPTPQSAREKEQKRDHWKLSVERALYSWRDYIQGNFTASPAAPMFSRSSMLLYRVASITLHTSILDLQILAGLTRLMGKPVNDTSARNSLFRLSTVWAGSEGAAKSVHHAVKLLSETLFPENHSRSRLWREGDPDLRGILHGKWCQYLATLTLWAWGAVTTDMISRENSLGDQFGTSFKSEDDIYDEANLTIDNNEGAFRQAKNYLSKMSGLHLKQLRSCAERGETRGLVIVMHNSLKAERWQLLREGSNICLKILNNQHRAHELHSEEFQAAYVEDRRRNLFGLEGPGSY